MTGAWWDRAVGSTSRLTVAEKGNQERHFYFGGQSEIGRRAMTGERQRTRERGVENAVGQGKIKRARPERDGASRSTLCRRLPLCYLLIHLEGT